MFRPAIMGSALVDRGQGLCNKLFIPEDSSDLQVNICSFAASARPEKYASICVHRISYDSELDVGIAVCGFRMFTKVSHGFNLTQSVSVPTF